MKVDQLPKSDSIFDIIDLKHHNNCKKVLESKPGETHNAHFKNVVFNESFNFNITQIPKSLRHFYSRNKAIVYISKDTLELGQRNKILVNDFGLTLAEATAALYLSDGCTVQEIAEVLGNTNGTVRQKFKTIFSKTDVKQ